MSMIWGALLIAAVLATGCGGGSATSAISQKQFIAQANTICKKGEAEESRRFKEAEEKYPTHKRVKAALRNKVLTWIFVTPYEKTIANLKSLGAPAGDEAKVAAIIHAMEKAKTAVKADPTQVLTNSTMYEEANELASEYGLESCTA
ncbi:MAG: hypothetical protein ACTHK6_05315 [Solirubrobacterales bacterium]